MFTRVIWAFLAISIKNNIANLQKIFIFISIQNTNFIPHFFLEILQDFANLLFQVIWAGLVIPTRINGINLQNNFHLHAKNQFPNSLFFFRYCKVITNVLFWVLWACLAMTSKNDTTSLQKTLRFIFMQNITFIPHLFLEILQRYCKLVILGTLGTPGHAHQK